ncbi:MAG: hypothetical protein ACYC7J_06705 [Syntrophales bacterium]
MTNGGVLRSNTVTPIEIRYAPAVERVKSGRGGKWRRAQGA